MSARAREYEDWIRAYKIEHNWNVRGLCSIATTRMAEAFPELTRVPGWCYHSTGSDEHWWLAAPDGTIIDPTASQFTGLLRYEPFKPGDEVRVGRCMNCGIGIYEAVDALSGPRRTSCSDECERALIKSMGA
jgi:hypothetical protein